MRFSGLDSSVRAITNLIAPVIAGFIILRFTELSSLFIVGILYGTSAVILIIFLRSMRAYNYSASNVGNDKNLKQDTDTPHHGMNTRGIIKSTFLEIWENTSWRYFLLVDILATVGLSTVLLLIFSLLRMDYQWEPDQIGIALAFMALGSLTSSILIARNNIDNLKNLFGFGAIVTGIGALLLSVSGGHILLVYPGALAIGAGSILQMKAMTLIVQIYAPQQRIGAWFSVIDGLERILNGVAIVGAALLMDIVGGFAVFFVFSLLLIGCGIWWSFYASRIILDQ